MRANTITLTGRSTLAVVPRSLGQPSKQQLERRGELAVTPLQVDRRAHQRGLDAPATPEQKNLLAQLSPQQVTATELAGEKITGMLTTAPGDDAPIDR